MSDRYPQFPPEAVSVTEVLKAEGFMGYLPGGEWYMERGTAIHEATAYYDKGTLDESTVDPQIAGYLEAWKKYRADTGYVPAFIEKSFMHPVYRYCGTLDRDFRDIKSGGPAPWHILQGAAYRGLCDDPRKDAAGWRTVYLREDGTYTLHIYKPQDLRDGLKIFLAALAVHNWKKLKGVKSCQPK